MKCSICGEEIIDGEKYFNTSSLSMWRKYRSKGVEKLVKITAICLDCIEDNSCYCDKYGDLIDAKYEERFK